MFFLKYIWIIPLLPAFGATMMFLFGRKLSGIPPRPRFAEDHGSHDAHGHAETHAAHDSHGAADAHGGGHDAHHVHEEHAWVNAICVGVVVLAFIMACGAVWQYTTVHT